MADPYGAVFSGVSDPSEHAVRVVPSDTADLPETPKSLWVGTGGNIAMVGDNAPSGSAPVTFVNVPSGSYLLHRPRRIYAAGTTATDILALY